MPVHATSVVGHAERNRSDPANLRESHTQHTFPHYVPRYHSAARRRDHHP